MAFLICTLLVQEAKGQLGEGTHVNKADLMIS